MKGFFNRSPDKGEKTLQAPAPAGAPSALVKDTTTQTFMDDVIRESQKQPVLVDIWAPWCGPCKTLAPVLEKVVAAAKGRVKLVKLNMDEEPAIPSQMGIQSIPAVVAFKDGRPVDAFMGALPESQIRAFIDKIAGAPTVSPVTETLATAEDALAKGAFGEAAQLFSAVLAAEPEAEELTKALAGLVRCSIGLEDLTQARQIFESISEELSKTPEAQAALKALELAEQAADVGDLAELQARIEREPDNLEARFDFALALNGKGKRKQAVDEFIVIVRKNRDWNDGAARKQLVSCFEAWGAKDPATLYGRQKLAGILFS